MDDTAAAPAAPPAARAPLTPFQALGLALAGGLLVGFTTSFAQGWLPDALSSMANSGGSWSLAAFLLALLGPRRWVSVVIGALALAAMVAGYDLASMLRGYGVAIFYTLFWGTAAVTIGPLLGWGADAVRHRTWWAPVGAGLMSGVLVGEGANGLLRLLETTSPVYWSLSVGAGLALLGWACVRRLRGAGPVLVAVASAAVMAGIVLGVYAGADALLNPV
ncbi:MULTISPECIES: DUF6518 family protein [unclassified Nocardiopsis]|uniref:DUF6518 family protein n=1 Tax=Nocardiopsis TaxID=2013 RepID=UPI00387B6E15